MKVEAQKEHQWLQKLVGEWSFEFEVPGEEGKPLMKLAGTESVRSLGDVWVLLEGKGQEPDGSTSTTMMTLGYDPQKQRYVGTWIGSMMTYLWVYEGELDASERVLTLSAEGPSMTGDGTTTQYKDVIELKSDDVRTLTALVQDADGSWQQLMSMSFHRKK